MPQPFVSVCIVTYQHARFIRQAIEGALMQKTDFPVEILVGEDESTDGTREICLDYAKRYPDRMRVFLRSRRDVVQIDGQARGSYNFRMTLREAKGEFIALCEGDDYWTDPEKLQRQVDYLRAHPECIGCFHDTKLVDADGQTLLKSYFQSEQDNFTQQDVLESLMSREPTCSLVFRKSAFREPLPEWYLRRPSDLYLDILLTSHGSLGFVRRNMGAYRKHAGGIWSCQREANQIIELIVRYKLLLADSSFERYKELLLRKIGEFQSSLFTRKDAAEEIERLERVVEEQTAVVKATQVECDRLSTEANRARTDAADVTKVVQEQTKAIRTIQAECDRLSSEAKGARAEAARAAKVVQQQTEAIRTIQAECDRLSSEAKGAHTEAAGAAKVVREQTKAIKATQTECDRLSTEAKEMRAETARAAKVAQTYIDDLLAQLKNLTGTSQQQATYISILEKERDRLLALVDTREIERCNQIISEQTAYIKTLEAQRAASSRQ